MWTVQIRDQTTCSVQPDLDLLCPQKASCFVISKEKVKILVEERSNMALLIGQSQINN